jgi:hypothetical protein
MNCTVDVNDRFGPTAGQFCPGRFDFTLLFEEAILTAAPLGIACMVGILIHCLQLKF